MNIIYDIKIHQKIINFNKFKLIYTHTLDYVKKIMTTKEVEKSMIRA
jgi:hypothetical protein